MFNNKQNTSSTGSNSSGNPVTDAANKMGEMKSTNPIPQENPSIISSEGAIGKHFNPEGTIGQIGEKIGGPFSSQGMIGKQFDASKDGLAGHVERAVDGPRNPAGSGKQ
ncbi:uncharacterized protein EI97DRAFT_435684 [Westerdykella ornata]|uniref:Uncharacterized protein n=1 Tax=Westerdykella ornata TaxID=318751 RepID=A0A6A6JC20_WESOR|nr:uncharacterized protein EI97DRAFT_435684 [Westerdykella ornata]KAF2273764.1 hypothetical protein EI97DRAFT_435684 [Westerdykella ornata]